MPDDRADEIPRCEAAIPSGRATLKKCGKPATILVDAFVPSYLCSKCALEMAKGKRLKNALRISDDDRVTNHKETT